MQYTWCKYDLFALCFNTHLNYYLICLKCLLKYYYCFMDFSLTEDWNIANAQCRENRSRYLLLYVKYVPWKLLGINISSDCHKNSVQQLYQLKNALLISLGVPHQQDMYFNHSETTIQISLKKTPKHIWLGILWLTFVTYTYMIY